MADGLIMRLRPGQLKKYVCPSSQAAAIKIGDLRACVLIHVKRRVVQGTVVRRVAGCAVGTIHVPLSLLFEANIAAAAALAFFNGFSGMSAAEESS
jgi:hypothetical protein